MPASKKRQGTGVDMRAEYDFSHGVRGKYASRLARGTNVVVLDPDVADVFKTTKAVNDALRQHLREEADPQGAALSGSPMVALPPVVVLRIKVDLAEEVEDIGPRLRRWTYSNNAAHDGLLYLVHVAAELNGFLEQTVVDCHVRHDL